LSSNIGGPYFKVKIIGLNVVEINYSNIKSIEENVEDAAKEVIELSDDECEVESQKIRVMMNLK
jgi:hypothetical protein